MNTAENIAYALPIGQTGGIREATRIVRKHAAHLDPKLFDDVVGAVVKRSRECLSQTSFSPALVPCISTDTASLLPGVAPLSLRSLAKHRQVPSRKPRNPVSRYRAVGGLLILNSVNFVARE
jgi:hypothetical protein